jgi:uncharacterized protein (DUF58 family)
LKDVSPVCVWPKIYPIAGQATIAGLRATGAGEGERGGRTGDFLGLREYRHGDCLRQVNWVATARSGDLVVTERCGPQCPRLDVHVDVSRISNRDQIADRIRVAASVLANLHRSAVPLRVHVGSRCIHVQPGWDGFVQMMDALADVPAEGLEEGHPLKADSHHVSITISADRQGDIVVCLSNPSVHRRSAGVHTHRVIRHDQDLANQLLSFWTEASDANLVA